MDLFAKLYRDARSTEHKIAELSIAALTASVLVDNNECSINNDVNGFLPLRQGVSLSAALLPWHTSSVLG